MTSTKAGCTIRSCLGPREAAPHNFCVCDLGDGKTGIPSVIPSILQYKINQAQLLLNRFQAEVKLKKDLQNVHNKPLG